ncbi:ABC transporter ATP-binding protein [Streptomyces sp. MUSC 125]|uniref:ATP-binding cassette domain-containing protein n=1 Tax=unclassified Streptomyces TaxID=2593676 RepID=UPI000583EC46|nr:MULTISPECIES: ATP-binding cassette domain-containing protein [unclassified Streptomyces]KIE27888.1 ABC transporter ATP-binding protein [Streptomyces sp. MUSC 125]MCH0558510.1 ATP-binding cassette domain-containing protein [Streptomyces sp. MUM 16J]
MRNHVWRFLRPRPWVLVRLAAWSVLEAGQTFVLGYALAQALDAGFLAGDAAAGLWWLTAAGLAVGAGAYGTGRVYGVVASLVEPVRDRLVVSVVARGVREADAGALSGLTQQVEIARDALAGLVMVSRSFLFTAAGALIGLFSLAPLLLAVVLPPLLAGVAVFAATLRPLARRQEAFLAADEALAAELGVVCPGLRDVTAAGAEALVAAGVGERTEAELRAAQALARWSVARVAAMAVGGQLPVVLLLATAPWLLGRGVTPGGLLGALAYVTQSLLPALQNLVHGLGTGGARLTVVLRRLITPPAGEQLAARPYAGAPPAAPSPDERLPAGRAPAGQRSDERLVAVRPPAAHPLPAEPPARAASHTPASRCSGVPALSLAAVSFAYGPASEPVLDGLDLVVPPGGHLAVVGPSGIGKSTLTALVAGLLRPGNGSVRVYGYAVPTPEAAASRVLIPQEAYVHGGTLAENLALFRPAPVPEAELLAAAERVGLTALLKASGGPGGRVDPAALSAGERQLIALTRAYLSPAPLALLDEATCHLDPESEARAERAFATRPGGTLVVVAHRISSARRADRILVMDGARTVCGTHKELLRTSALYRDLAGGWTTRRAPLLG